MKKKIIISLAIAIFLIIVVVTAVICINGSHEHTYSEEYMFDKTGHWQVSTCHNGKYTTEVEKHNLDGVTKKCLKCDYQFVMNPTYEAINNHFNNIGFYNIDVSIKKLDSITVFKLRRSELRTELAINDERFVEFYYDYAIVYDKDEDGSYVKTILEKSHNLETYLRENTEYQLICEIIDQICNLRQYYKYSEETGVATISNVTLKDSILGDVRGSMHFVDKDVNKLSYIKLNCTVVTVGEADSHTSVKYDITITPNEDDFEKPQFNDEMSDISPDGYYMANMDELEALIEKHEGCIIVDIRTNKEFYYGHLPMALNVSFETIMENKSLGENINNDAWIVVYGADDTRSKDAAKLLIELGYTNVIDVGTISDWKGEIIKDYVPDKK